MNAPNFQKQLDSLVAETALRERAPRLLLHSCCAPCSSYVLEYLSEYFAITVLYYNPNISPRAEYACRIGEQRRLISELKTKNKIEFLETGYAPDVFYKAVAGLENEPERGRRCDICFRLRLEEAARVAREGGFDFFCTTLSISPMKDAEKLNAIGGELAQKYGVAFLPSDFKKRGGYKRSVELSRKYNLYRQNYCGCIFSKREAEIRATSSGGNTRE